MATIYEQFNEVYWAGLPIFTQAIEHVFWHCGAYPNLGWHVDDLNAVARCGR
jgi:hypothetical protein